MFGFNSTLSKQHTLAAVSFETTAKRLCVGYWAIAGLNPTSIKQDPMKMASFYKESGN